MNKFTNKNRLYRLPPIAGIQDFVNKNKRIFNETVKSTTVTISENDFMLGENRFKDCDYNNKLEKLNKTLNKQYIDKAVKQFNESGLDGSFKKCKM